MTRFSHRAVESWFWYCSMDASDQIENAGSYVILVLAVETHIKFVVTQKKQLSQNQFSEKIVL